MWKTSVLLNISLLECLTFVGPGCHHAAIPSLLSLPDKFQLRVKEEKKERKEGREGGRISVKI